MFEDHKIFIFSLRKFNSIIYIYMAFDIDINTTTLIEQSFFFPYIQGENVFTQVVIFKWKNLPVYRDLMRR